MIIKIDENKKVIYRSNIDKAATEVNMFSVPYIPVVEKGKELYFDPITNEFSVKDRLLPQEVLQRYEEEQKKNKYKMRVQELIRQRYSLEDELEISRKRADTPDEFQAYYEYIETCIATAKTEFDL
jgi:hypothetical protein